MVNSITSQVLSPTIADVPGQRVVLEGVSWQQYEYC